MKNPHVKTGNNLNRIQYRQRRHAFFTIILAVGDMLLVALSLLLGYYLRFYQEIGVSSGIVKQVPIAPPEMYLKLILITVFLFLILFIILNLYRRDRARLMIDELHNIWRALNYGFVVIASVTFFLRFEDMQISRLVLLYSYVFAILALPAFRLTLLKIERWAHSKGYITSNVLIIGLGDMANIVSKKIFSNPQLGYRIKGVCAEVSELSGSPEDLEYLGSLSVFESILVNNSIDEVLISESSISHYKLLEIVSICERMGVYVKMVPTVYDLLIDFADVNDLDGLPLVAIREQPMYEFRLVGKRLFDIVFSFSVLLLAFPVCLIIIVLIKRDSKGSVFFSQVRAGVGGKPFRMYKFRTMYTDAEKQLSRLVDLETLREPVFKLNNDPRVTRIGHFLRRTSLDELPQFWNVLKGDMSIVGPRPEETLLAQRYNIWQQRRLKAKPGITGMQQIMCRGTTSLSDRIRYDIYYLRKHSLLLDMWIILKTLPVVLSGRGAR
jgi:exopolysaccharide biosynthesis polyprenyl glycosylphosphotransferase